MEPGELRRRFRNGGSLSDLAHALQLAPNSDDLDVSKQLIRAIADHAIGRLSVESERASSTGDVGLEAAELGLLGRLSTIASPAESALRNEEDAIRLNSIESISTLLAIASGGSLFQRRAAMRRLTELLTTQLAEHDIEAIVSNFRDEHERSTELAAELTHLRAAFPGALGRESRAELDSVRALFATLEQDIRATWDGHRDEPLRSLSSVDLARTAIHLRDASDLIVAHLVTVLEGHDGATDDFRATLLSALVHAGDTRLVPALIALLGSRTTPVVMNAAKALGHIDDARTLPALRLAYDRSVSEIEKTVLTGALGRHGDLRGATYLRQVLSSPSPKLLTPCLEALETMANRSDLERLEQLLRSDIVQETDRILVVRVLGKLGASESAPWLEELIHNPKTSSAMRVEAEEALQSVEAQVALRGETLIRTTKPLHVLVPKAEGTLRRALARVEFALGNLNVFLRRRAAALSYFYAAAERDRTWALPQVAAGRMHNHDRRFADAIAAFREAFSRDRRFLESQRWIMKSVAIAFLERTEALLKEGQPEIARGVLAELLDFDLRKVPSAHRFEARRRYDLMRAIADRSESERTIAGGTT